MVKARANDCMDDRARFHAALDKVMDRKRRGKDRDYHDEGWGEGAPPTRPYDDVHSEDAPAETYDPAQSKTGREAMRARLHAALDRCIDAVRGRKRTDDGTSEGAKKAWQSRQRGGAAKAKSKPKSMPSVEAVASMPPDQGFKAYQEMAGPTATRGEFRMFVNQVKRDTKANAKAKKVGYHEAEALGKQSRSGSAGKARKGNAVQGNRSNKELSFADIKAMSEAAKSAPFRSNRSIPFSEIKAMSERVKKTGSAR